LLGDTVRPRLQGQRDGDFKFIFRKIGVQRSFIAQNGSNHHQKPQSTG